MISSQQEEIDKMSGDRKSTRLNSSHSQISYAVFCLKKKRSCREQSSLSDGGIHGIGYRPDASEPDAVRRAVGAMVGGASGSHRAAPSEPLVRPPRA